MSAALLAIGQKIEKSLLEAELDSKQDVASWLRHSFSDLAPHECNAFLAELTGLGPLELLLTDATISDIYVNGGQDIWLERAGVLEKSQLRFYTPNGLDRTVRRMLQPLGRKVDRKNPVADGRLADGSRFCVVVPPAVVGSTHLCIRKFNKQIHSLEALVEKGFLNQSGLQSLCGLIATRKNILVSGPTGAGKTTLLNALAQKISSGERIITIEDTAELQLQHPHVVSLETRPPNSEGEGAISLRALLRASLRMRPDRILLGECRGEEALDLLHAFNTGHGGGLSTIHANSPREALHKLEMLTLLGAKNLDSSVAKAFIQGSVHALVHVDRQEGRRFVRSIQELRGVEAGIFLLRDCAV